MTSGLWFLHMRLLHSQARCHVIITCIFDFKFCVNNMDSDFLLSQFVLLFYGFICSNVT